MLNLHRLLPGLLAGLVMLFAAVRTGAAVRPNVVLVMTDDQGYGEMSCHGNPVLRTPQLDRLHSGSVRFTDFQVSPTCAPTRAALLTGRHEFRSGVSHTIHERERLDLAAVTLPQILSRAGYRTGLFGKWHLGDEEAYQPGRRGFEETFVHGGGGIGQTYAGSCGDAPGNAYHNPWIRHNGRFVATQGYCTDVFINRAIAWMDEQRQARRPFFACITPNAPHDPLVSPGAEWEAPYVGRGLSTNLVKYYAMIAHFDTALGRLLDRIEQWGIDRETLVIFLTDNGHSVADGYNAGMRGIKGTAYQGGTRVPSFWRWPGTLAEGVDVTRLAAHLDILPTLVELCGARVSREERARWEGRSLVPLLKNPDARWPDRLLFTHFGRWPSGQAAAFKYRVCSVRNEQFRFVNDSELYDLRRDPGETVNVIADHPAVVERFRRAYDAWWDSVLPSLRGNEWAIGPEVNPYKQAFWEQQGGGPDAALLQVMDPRRKFPPPLR